MSLSSKTVQYGTFVAGLSLFLISVTAGRSHALTIGPDAYGYIADDSVGLVRADALNGTSVLSNSDDGTALIPIGFSFNFYGTSYSQVSVSNNGLLTFGGSNNDWTNTDLTATGTSGDYPSIAVLWDDWVTYQNLFDQVLYDTSGPVGDRQFVVEWFVNSGFPSSPSPVTFQAVLHESDNSIDLYYDDTVSGDFRDNGASATIGIRDTDGHNNGRVLQYSHNAPVLAATGSGIRITRVIPEPTAFFLSLIFAASMAGTRKQRCS